MDYAWALGILGNVYRELGNYNQAKIILEKSNKVYRDIYGDCHIKTASILMYLGDVYKKFGNHIKAKDLIRKSYGIYKNYYGINHIETARVMRSLGHVYFLENNIETAEKLFHKALGILQNNNHPDHYMILEDLVELYAQKSMIAVNKGEQQQAQYFKDQAINCLKQTLKIVKDHFPKDCPHIVRIQSKLDSI